MRKKYLKKQWLQNFPKLMTETKPWKQENQINYVHKNSTTHIKFKFRKHKENLQIKHGKNTVYLEKNVEKGEKILK